MPVIPAQPPKWERIAVMTYLKKDTKAYLEQLAYRENRSMSAAIQQLIEDRMRADRTQPDEP